MLLLGLNSRCTAATRFDIGITDRDVDVTTFYERCYEPGGSLLGKYTHAVVVGRCDGRARGDRPVRFALDVDREVAVAGKTGMSKLPLLQKVD